MKEIGILTVAWCMSLLGLAQLPDGSIAPDFTATDIEGVEYNLYDLLDEGKQVILQFSATWCGPCWSYTVGGALEEVYEIYGPDGTDEVRIFFLEADDSTTSNDLYGTGTATQGDWTSVVNFPIIDDAGDIFNAYQCTYYPTIFTVCPNRMLTESGQISASDHATIFQTNECATASLVNDPALLSYTGPVTACLGDPIAMSVDLMNLGLANLQSCTIAVWDGSTELLSFDWSGDLATYGVINVDLGMLTFEDETNFTIEITSGDDNASNNSCSGSVEFGTIGTSLIHVEIMVDNWPQEIGWAITDAAGLVVEQVNAGEIVGYEGEIFEWWVSAADEGCFTFEISDAYGDGINGSIWGSVDGYCTVTSWYPGGTTLASTLFTYDGSYGFDFEYTSIQVLNGVIPGCTDAQACNYDPAVEEDNGSCEYESCAGCMDAMACNYNGQATISDSTQCTYPGCQDPNASNFDASAGCPDECVYLTYDCASLGDDGWLEEVEGMYPAYQEAMHGIAWSGEWVLNMSASVIEPASGVVYPVHHFEWATVAGIPDWVFDSTFEVMDLGPNGQACLTASGTPDTPGYYEVTVSGELFITIFGQPFSIGVETYSAWIEVLENPNPIAGCTYPLAANFVSYANLDDGGCLFPGCTNAEAGNYSPLANVDDGSCGEACNENTDSACSTDSNGDGQVNVSDLLMLLGEFGATCE